MVFQADTQSLMHETVSASASGGKFVLLQTGITVPEPDSLCPAYSHYSIYFSYFFFVRNAVIPKFDFSC